MSPTSQTVRSEESRSDSQHQRCVEGEAPAAWPMEGATRAPTIEELAPPVCLPTAYGNLMRLMDGRNGTVCVPLSSSGDIPSPVQSVCAGATDADQIQSMWNQVLADSNKQVVDQTSDQAKRAADDKTKKLERLLMVALSSGDIDTAMLLFAGLESSQSNKLATSLMNRMQQLQQQRQDLTNSLTQNQTGDEKKDAQNAQTANAKAGEISTELNMLQTFLQDITEHKNETQQMASNFIKSRHDTAMSIIRNMS